MVASPASRQRETKKLPARAKTISSGVSSAEDDMGLTEFARAELDKMISDDFEQSTFPIRRSCLDSLLEEERALLIVLKVDASNEDLIIERKRLVSACIERVKGPRADLVVYLVVTLEKSAIVDN